MKWSVARGVAMTLATVVMVCGGWLLLAPAALGGPVSVVVTSGISMTPTFHTGDLALLRSSSTYHVGDVVGYHSHTLRGAVVMHRLVGQDGGRWTTKGDHNTWLDPDHPTNADLVGKLWIHVPKGGIVLTRMLLPLAFVTFVGLLVPFPSRRSKDEAEVEAGADGESAAHPTPPARGGTGRGRHAGTRRKTAAHRPDSVTASRPIDGLPDWLTSRLCAQVLAGGLSLAIVGAAVAMMGFARPQSRQATVAHPWQTNVAFGWTGTSAATRVYPGGTLTAPDPIFTKIVDRLTMTADVTARGHSLGSASLMATLSDASGWTSHWQLATAGKRLGPTLHLSGTLDLRRLLAEVAYVQSITGVSSEPTLTLSVNENGQQATVGPAGPAGPSLAFALSTVTLKPQGSLTVTQTGSTSSRALVPAAISVSGHKVQISELRRIGAIAVALGLLGALTAGLVSRRLPAPTTESDLLRLYAGRVVHLDGSTDSAGWAQSCLDVTDAQSLAAFAALPSAVLYVVASSDGPTFVAERGATRLRYLPHRAVGVTADATDVAAALSAVPQQRDRSADEQVAPLDR